MRRRCPWDELERRPGVEVVAAALPHECGGAIVQRRGGRSWIVLDVGLDPVEQRCRLAHELVHLDRGSVRGADAPDTWDAVVAREELAVDREVAAWLVPFDELARVVTRCASGEHPVTAELIATEFEVTPPIATLALAALRELRPGDRQPWPGSPTAQPRQQPPR